MSTYTEMVTKPIKYAQMMGSAAHTYGNALAFIQKWLLDEIMPKRDTGESIFKTIHVGSAIAHRQLRSTPQEMIKKTKPMVAFRARIDTDDDRFLQGTPLISRMIQDQINFGKEGLQTFFFDQKNKIAVKYQLNRTVMFVDVVMAFSTKIEQLNYLNYIQNAISIGHPFDLRTCFESYLSIEMMKVIGDLAGVPVANNGNVSKFLRYMNQNSVYPITYKLQGSTNTQEFYRYYPVKIDTLINNLNHDDDGEKIDQITSNYQISFTIRMEFYSTGFYFLFSDRIFKTTIPSIADDASIIPIFTDVLLRDDWDLAVGWNQFSRVSCRLNKVHDSVTFDSILNPSILAAVRYCESRKYSTELVSKFDTTDIIDVKIRKQGHLISEGVDYEIDYSTFTIKFKNSDYGYDTYTLMVCINIENINEITKMIFALK